MEFIDDYQLLASVESTYHQPPSLVLIDTGHVGGTPAQTTFYLSPWFSGLGVGGPYLLLDQGGHEPSPEESLAPFHSDPAQRVVMLDMRCSVRYLVVSVGALLELKSRGRAEIRWDEWKHHVAIPRLGGRGRAAAFCVSGCRLLFVFFTQFSGHGQMEMYDFSMWGRARYLSEEVNQLFGLRYLSSTPGRVPIPQRGLTTLRGGHGSIVFYHVSAMVSFSWECD